MFAFIVRRIAFLVLSLLVVVTVSFVIVRVAPGSPYTKERAMSQDVIEMRKEQAGMGGGFFEDYARYLGNVIQGDFGESQVEQGVQVSDRIGKTLPVSLTLGLIALVMALAMGVTLGTIAGVKQNGVLDFTSMTVALVGISVPNFVLAVLLQAVFASKDTLGILPGQGWEEPANIILPAVSLAMPFAARIARLTRVGMIEVFRQDFVRTARAKGLKESDVVVNHCLIHAILPVVSYLGPAAAGILMGSLVIERIFNIPGIGQIFVDAALKRDYFMILGTIEVYAVLLMLLILVTDILYALIDPRIAAGMKEGK